MYRKRLPDYYVTKEEATVAGWDSRQGNLANVCPDKMIGGNLDALWDCLTDMPGGINYIEIHGFDVIEKKFSEEIE